MNSIVLKLKSLNSNDILNYVFIFYAFCLPLSRAGIVLSIFLMIIFWIIEGNFKYKFKVIFKNKFIIFSTILCIYLLFTVLFKDSLSYDFNHFKRLWYYIALFVIITSIKKEYIFKCLSVFIIAMMISEIYSYGIFFELLTSKHGSVEDPTPFMNHLHYGVFLSFTALLLLNRFFLEKRCPKTKIIYAIFFITVVGNLFITGGRMGQLAFLISIFILIFDLFEHKIRAFFISIALVLVIVILAFNFSNTFQKRVYEAQNDIKNLFIENNYNTSWGLRASAWVVTYEILKKNPLFGTSIADIDNDYKKMVIDDKIVNMEYNDINEMATLWAGYHNDFLELTSGGGLVAFMLFILAFLYLFKMKIKNQEFNNIKIIFLSIFLISIMADNFLRYQFTMNLFIFIVGILIAYYNYESLENTKSINNNQRIENSKI